MDSLVPIFVTAGLATGGVLLTGFVKWVVSESLRDYFSEHLPGLLAIQFNAWRDKSDGLYAEKHTEVRVDRLETRLEQCPLFVKGKI